MLSDDPLHLEPIHVISNPKFQQQATQLAQAARVRVYTIETAEVGSRDELMAALEKGLALPEYFGRNWDALEECLRNLPLRSGEGGLVLFRNADALLKLDPRDLKLLTVVLRSVSEFWEAEGRPFTVFFLGSSELAGIVGEAA